MKNEILVNYITGEIIETSYTNTMKEIIEDYKNEYHNKGLNIVVGRDYLVDHTIWFIYDIDYKRSCSRLDLEEKVTNYLKK